MVVEKGTQSVPSSLLQEIVDYVETSGDGQPSQSGKGEEVVLELEVDGYTYTLLRTSVEERPSDIHLSPREKEIARLISKGLSNRTIAMILGISPWTVATHLRRVFAKLGVSSRAEMVARVLTEGLLEPTL